GARRAGTATALAGALHWGNRHRRQATRYLGRRTCRGAPRGPAPDGGGDSQGRGPVGGKRSPATSAGPATPGGHAEAVRRRVHGREARRMRAVIVRGGLALLLLLAAPVVAQTPRSIEAGETLR